MKKFVLWVMVSLLMGCGGASNKPDTNSGTATTAPAPIISIVATINGEPITEADLNTSISNRLAQIKTQIYDLQRQGISSIVEERLLKKEAEKRGMTSQQLIKEEVSDKVGDISDKELEDFYTQNKPRFGDKTLAQVRETIKQPLIARKSAVYLQNYIDRLEDKADIQILITRPTIKVGIDDDPMQGSKNAPVTIVEFTDYQCPFCGRARPTIQQLVKDYGNKIQYVLRDFPLDFHPFAKKAAEAADCAGAQRKYWEYGDILWENQGALDVASLKKYAGELKLDQKKFDECLDSDKFLEEINKDIADGTNAGVSGTPSFFINGQMITGARPIEQFKEIIDQELKEKKGKN
jgi:protein-disulfide isomerase